MVTYTPNIPQPQDIPANSQSQILQNFQYLVPSAATTGLKRDHQMLLVDTVNTDGVHKQVTFAANIATPGFIGNVSVVYPNTANGQSQLFFNNAAQNVQLTTAIASVPTSAALGASFLPGGLLIQWGTDTKNTGGLTTYLVAFSAPPYSVVLTPRAATSSANGLISVSPGAASFQIGNFTGSAQSYTYNWIAIGPA